MQRVPYIPYITNIPHHLIKTSSKPSLSRMLLKLLVASSIIPTVFAFSRFRPAAGKLSTSAITSAMSASASAALSWDDLKSQVLPHPDLTNGPFLPQALTRTFGQPEESIRVTLYRDHHAWCPYCQKIGLYLEEHKIPYKIRKVTMFCYGNKESWYRRIVPSGYLPAVDIDGQIITESDDILFALDQTFGPLNNKALADDDVLVFRRLERKLFGAWCGWLCQRHFTPIHEARAQQVFESVAKEVDAALGSSSGPFMLGNEYSIADIIFTPYIERMSASLTYYKGYSVRKQNPNINAWFEAIEKREVYLGWQSDFHTHVHDLPPQMGSCNSNGKKEALAMQDAIDGGGVENAHFEFETSVPPTPERKFQALSRVYKHREILSEVNPLPADQFDEAIRAALTNMLDGNSVQPPKGSASGLRYLRDRISVPRDMPLHAARELRLALEKTAALDGDAVGPPISARDRRDQNPQPFVEAREKLLR